MAARRPRRAGWRRSKSKRRPEKRHKKFAAVLPALPNRSQAQRDEQIDRLLLSALKFWETERDLIEERLRVARSAAAHI
jgi:hypothetical protein